MQSGLVRDQASEYDEPRNVVQMRFNFRPEPSEALLLMDMQGFVSMQKVSAGEQTKRQVGGRCLLILSPASHKRMHTRVLALGLFLQLVRQEGGASAATAKVA
jgi:hypothetical protein